MDELSEGPANVSEAADAYQSTVNGYQDTVFPERPETLDYPEVGGEGMPEASGRPEELGPPDVGGEGMPGPPRDYSWEGHMARAREWQRQYEAEHGPIARIVPGYGNMDRFLKNQGPTGYRDYRGLGAYGAGRMSEMGADPVAPGLPASGAQGPLQPGGQTAFHGMLDDGMKMLNGLASHVMTNPVFANAPQQRAAALSKIIGEASQLAKLGVRGGKNGEGLFNENFSGHQQAELSRLGAQETQARQLHAQGDINDDELRQWLGQLEARRAAIQPSSLLPNGQPPMAAQFEAESHFDPRMGGTWTRNPKTGEWKFHAPPKADSHDTGKAFQAAMTHYQKEEPGILPTDPRIGAYMQSFLGYQHGMPVAGQHPSQQQPQQPQQPAGVGGPASSGHFGMAGGQQQPPQAPQQVPAAPKNPKQQAAADKAAGIMTEKEWSDQRHKIATEIRSRIDAQRKEAHAAKGEGREYTPTLTPDMEQQAVEEEMAQHGLGRGGWSDYAAMRRAGLDPRKVEGHGPARTLEEAAASPRLPFPGQQQAPQQPQQESAGVMAQLARATQAAAARKDAFAELSGRFMQDNLEKYPGGLMTMPPDQRRTAIYHLKQLQKFDPSIAVKDYKDYGVEPPEVVDHGTKTIPRRRFSPGVFPSWVE